MSTSLIGNAWLRDAFKLPSIQLSHESQIDTSRAERAGDAARETFPKGYAVKGDPLQHIEFALKYDGAHLDLLAQVFRILPANLVASFVAGRPSGKAARQIGFLYEFLTGNTLPLAGVEIAGAYVPILDQDRFLTASTRKVTRWHVDDNLLGPPAFAPTIRRTAAVAAGIARDWGAEIAALKENTEPAIFYRALSQFYLQETRSSFLIENERPGPQRTQRFAAALRAAGGTPEAGSLATQRLIELQNIIIGEDSPYAVKALRENQNFVGRSLGPRKGGLQVYYVSPPPAFVPSMMQGLQDSSERLEAAHPLAHAAAAAFGFVFIHPFEDGNGRIHRFLLHDVLARRKFVTDGLVLPLSMTILGDPVGYSRTLEAFSAGVMSRVRYDIEPNGSLSVRNPKEVESAWRYPDLTPQVEYIQEITGKTIAAMPEELAFLRRHDDARRAIQDIADMPDQRLDTLLGYLHDGSGKLSKNRRKNWPELPDESIGSIEQAYQEAFNLTDPPASSAREGRE